MSAAGVRAQPVDELGRYYEWTRPDIQALVPADAGRILDVGCGSGALGAELKQKLGAWVAGVEFFPQAAEVAAGRLDWLACDDLDEVTELPGDLDVAICGDVLEHLRDPERLLGVLHRHLSASGIVIASVPNVKHWTVLAPLLLSDRWHYEDQGLLDRTHVHFFTLVEFQMMLARQGFAPTHIGAHNMPVPPELDPLVELAERLGAGSDVRQRLGAYQYLVVAQKA